MQALGFVEVALSPIIMAGANQIVAEPEVSMRDEGIGAVLVRREGSRVTIAVEIPDRGEPSAGGHAENLTDPREWTPLIQGGDELAIKLTICRPYRVARRWHR